MQLPEVIADPEKFKDLKEKVEVALAVATIVGFAYRKLSTSENTENETQSEGNAK